VLSISGVSSSSKGESYFATLKETMGLRASEPVFSSLEEGPSKTVEKGPNWGGKWRVSGGLFRSHHCLPADDANQWGNHSGFQIALTISEPHWRATGSNGQKSLPQGWSGLF